MQPMACCPSATTQGRSDQQNRHGTGARDGWRWAALISKGHERVVGSWGIRGMATWEGERSGRFGEIVRAVVWRQRTNDEGIQRDSDDIGPTCKCM